MAATVIQLVYLFALSGGGVSYSNDAHSRATSPTPLSGSDCVVHYK